MPLRRPNVTIASRVMLPIYPLFAAGVGVSFVATPLERLVATPSLRYAQDLVGLRAWGVGYLLVAALLTGALLAGSRRVYAYGLAVMALWLAVYALMVLLSAFTGASSWSAWAWPAFIAAACWATLLSLLSQET